MEELKKILGHRIVITILCLAVVSSLIILILQFTKMADIPLVIKSIPIIVVLFTVFIADIYSSVKKEDYDTAFISFSYYLALGIGISDMVYILTLSRFEKGACAVLAIYLFIMRLVVEHKNDCKNQQL